ncbi:MAG: PorV/PorQ family protein [candidate division WOR-3 bacterium]|nr:PorV/PorQ family protein [candidate division WOR-3 bacterium]
MKKGLIVGVLLFCSLPTVGDSLEAGAVFLMIFPGSRATSMGGAFTSAEGDIFSTYYNDAALAFKGKKMLGLQHANWLPGLYQGMYYEYMSFLLPLSKDFSLSSAVTYLTTGETEASDSSRSWNWITYDVSAKVSGIMAISENLGVSIGMKYIYSFLAPDMVIEWLADITGVRMQGGTGQAWAVDGSVFYRWSDLLDVYFLDMKWFEVLRLGASVQNIGPNISYIEGGDSDPLPSTLRLGSSLSILENERHQLRVNGDLIKVLVGMDNSTDFSGMWGDTWKALGFEYTFNELFSLRSGYFLDRVGKRVGPTFGAGIMYKNFRFDLSVDQEIYEFKTQNYRISAQYSF